MLRRYFTQAGVVKEIWEEIIEGVGVKTLVLILLSIPTCLLLCAYFSYTLQKKSTETKKIEKRTESSINSETKPAKTNFTQ